MSDTSRNRITKALVRRIDPADSHQLGGQTFRPLSEADQPMALMTPFDMPANLMRPGSVAQTPYLQGQDRLSIAPPSLRQAENEIYAQRQRMLRGRP